MPPKHYFEVAKKASGLPKKQMGQIVPKRAKNTIKLVLFPKGTSVAKTAQKIQKCMNPLKIPPWHTQKAIYFHPQGDWPVLKKIPPGQHLTLNLMPFNA